MTLFDEEGVVDALKAPLDKRHVAQRTQSGRSMSYVEGWHVIAEANRIFGFGAWTRETVEMREVRPPELVKNSNGKETWRVGFIAKVRITVDGVMREGTGFGSGALPDLGEAYESAVKEAETDAMKRAFMTFGNPFGLALYDKEQTNVVSAPPPSPEPKASSASQKKGLLDIDADLTDCHTILDVDKCAKVWAEIMKRDGWAKDFIDIARPKFQARRDEIHTRAQFEADAAEQFPEQQEAAE